MHNSFLLSFKDKWGTAKLNTRLHLLQRPHARMVWFLQLWQARAKRQLLLHMDLPFLHSWTPTADPCECPMWGRFPSVVPSSVLLQMLSRSFVQICGSVVQQSSVDLQGSSTGKTHNNHTGTGIAQTGCKRGANTHKRVHSTGETQFPKGV